jgi:TonB family protein
MGLHLLLAGILLIGPAFVSSSRKSEDIPIITFIPIITTDEKVSGGGDPRGRPPEPVQAQQPATPPQPAARQQSPPPREAVREPVKEATPSPEPQRRRIEPSLTPVRRSSPSQTAAQRRAEAQARERAEAQRRAAAQVGSAISDLRGGLSSSTSIELQGPGGGGLPYANWEAAVRKFYDDAWAVPDHIAGDSAAVTVSVTIARDGTIVSSRIVTLSGNADADHSVQAALDRAKMRKGPPLPSTARERERTVTIIFNLKTKLLTG